MPGTPIDRLKGGLAKLQTDDTEHTENGGEGENRENRENLDDRQRSYRPEPEARQLTQTDRLNKRLLQSLLERMNKLDGKFDRFMDNKDEDDEESGEF